MPRSPAPLLLPLLACSDPGVETVSLTWPLLDVVATGPQAAALGPYLRRREPQLGVCANDAIRRRPGTVSTVDLTATVDLPATVGDPDLADCLVEAIGPVFTTLGPIHMRWTLTPLPVLPVTVQRCDAPRCIDAPCPDSIAHARRQARAQVDVPGAGRGDEQVAATLAALDLEACAYVAARMGTSGSVRWPLGGGPTGPVEECVAAHATGLPGGMPGLVFTWSAC